MIWQMPKLSSHLEIATRDAVTARTRSETAARGFTLIEVTVVLAIVGVLAALSFPSIHDMSARANEPLELARVESVLHEARTYARRTNQCVKVTRTGTGSGATAVYSLTYDTFTDGTPACPTATAITPAVKPTTLATGITIGAFANGDSVTVFRFARSGGTRYASPVTFNVTSALGLNRKVQIFPGAGTTRVGG